AGQGLGMAAEASIENLFRRQRGERNDGRFTAMRRDMSLAWTVATLASGVGRLFLSRSNALEMGVLVEREPDVRMASLTDHASNETVLRISGNSRAEKCQGQEYSEWRNRTQ